MSIQNVTILKNSEPMLCFLCTLFVKKMFVEYQRKQVRLWSQKILTSQWLKSAKVCFCRTVSLMRALFPVDNQTPPGCERLHLSTFFHYWQERGKNVQDNNSVLALQAFHLEVVIQLLQLFLTSKKQGCATLPYRQKKEIRQSELFQ